VSVVLRTTKDRQEREGSTGVDDGSQSGKRRGSVNSQGSRGRQREMELDDETVGMLDVVDPRVSTGECLGV
jgi:hypothetical protein